MAGRTARAPSSGLSRDADLRRPLLALLRERGEARIVEELVIEIARADVAAVRAGGLDLYEIKSDGDSLARLPGQVAAYGLYADRCTIVVAARHRARGVVLVPSWWGVLVAHVDGGGVRLYEERAAGTPESSHHRQARLLWSDELRALCDRLGVRLRSRERSRSAMVAALALAVPADELRAHARAALRERNGGDGARWRV